MSRINSKNTTITLLSNTSKLIKTNTSTEMSTILETQLHTTTTQVRFLKINEKMTKLWDRTQSFLLEEVTIQGCTPTLIIETNQRKNLSGRKRNDFEESQPKRLNNSYIQLRTTSWWKIPYGRRQNNQELNFENQNPSNQRCGKTATNLKYLYSQTMSLIPKIPCFQEMSKHPEKQTIIWTTYSMRAFYRKD